MNALNKTNDSNIYHYDEVNWNELPNDLFLSIFSDLGDWGDEDLRSFRGKDISNTFKEAEYLAMRLINPKGEIDNLIFVGASSDDPKTWSINADINSMQSGSFVALGKHHSESLITSCIKTALHLRFKLGMPVICTLSPTNTDHVIKGIQRLARMKKVSTPVIFVLCENIAALVPSHENVIRLAPQSIDFISLCNKKPKYLRKEIQRAIDDLKSSDLYPVLEEKARAAAKSARQKYVPGGAELFENIRQLFRKHIYLRESDLILAALFILFTYAFRKSAVIPFLYIVSPEAGAGKTVMLSIAKALCANPYDSSDLTPASLARLASTYETVIIDEYDQQEDIKGLTGVLNAGYRPGISNYSRSGPGKTTVELNLASARVIAGIGYPKAPTTRERSMFVNLQVCPATMEFPEVSTSKLALDYLKSECQKWELSVKELTELPELDRKYRIGWSSRSKENYSCLLKVAACLSDEILELAAEACEQHAKDEKPEESKTQEMLIDILDLISKKRPDKILRMQLAKLLIALPDRPWKSYATQEHSFSLQMGSVLRSYRVSTGSVRVATVTGKGYKLAQFDQLLERFGYEVLPANESTAS